MSGSLAGKRALIFGVASDDSIAWAIAQELAAHGATCVMGYQKRFLSRVLQLFKDKPWIEGYLECDVATEESVAGFFQQAAQKHPGHFDMMVHAIGFAPATALQDEVIRTTEADWNTALTVSSYSLVRLARHTMPVMNESGAILSLTYLGADRFVPGYRVMSAAKAALQELNRELAYTCGREKQVRVNTISAGPIRTLAGSGVPGFSTILDWMKHASPLARNVSQQDVAKSAYFLLSDLASGVTGQLLYVDAGYSIMGVPPGLDKLLGQPMPTSAPGTQAQSSSPPAPAPQTPAAPAAPAAPRAAPLVFGKKP